MLLESGIGLVFVIADISGYTHFVSSVELDHAQDIIADIMDTGQGAQAPVPPRQVRRRRGVRLRARRQGRRAFCRI